MPNNVDSGVIRSRDNPILKTARALQNKKARDEHGLALLEGVRLVEDAASSNVRLRSVLFTESLRRRPAGQTLLDRLYGFGIPVYEADEQAFNTASDTSQSQGIIAFAPIRPCSLESVIDRTAKDGGVTLALEGVQDPGNVGTIIRAADAFNASGVIIGPGTADPYSPKCLRAGMGGTFRVPIAAAHDWAECLELMGVSGIVLVADTDSRATLSWKQDLSSATFVILANEGSGPSQQSLDKATGIVRIPMPGSAESLNVAVSASVLLYEAVRQRIGSSLHNA